MSNPPEQGDLLPHSPHDETKSSSRIALSINSLAREFDCSREFMRKVIDASGIRPAKHVNGSPLYLLREVVAAWRTPMDEASMKPHERLAHVKAIKVQDEIRLRRGELCLATEVERTLATICGALARDLEVLVDEIERDLGAPTHVLMAIEEKIDQARDRMYESIQKMANADDEQTSDASPAG